MTARHLFLAVALLANAQFARAQLLMSDSFDVGNTNGGAPAGWTLTVPSSTQISVVNSALTVAASSPYCVRLIDNSASLRPEMYQDFHPAATGRAYASFKLPSTAAGPAYLHLRTSGGTLLCAVVLDSTNGKMGYDTNTGTIATTVPWTTGVWQRVEVEWFADNTFNAYLGTTQFVQRATFSTAASPERVLIAVGTNAGVGRTGFVDNVQVVVTEARLDDDFDAGNTFGSNPANWVVSKPANTNIRVVDSTVRAPLSLSNCVEFSDNSGVGAPEMYAGFTQTSEGCIQFSAFVPSTNQAPLAVHLRTTNGTFLTAIRLGEDGKVGYNATAGGAGPFTISSVSWTTNGWQTIRVDWFSNNTFSAFLGSNQVVANVPFGTNTQPGRVLFRLADNSSTGRVAYLDNVLVTRTVFPGAARYTENSAWLAYAYLSTQSWVDDVPQVAFQMRTNYRVPYWFVNVGLINSSGTMSNPPARMVQFLNKLKTWEDQNGYQFKVLAWMNGTTDIVDINNASVRSNIVGETKRFVSTTLSNSLIAGATRAFDGIQLDLEPIGKNGSDTRFNNLKLLFTDIRTGFESLGLGNKLTSLTPHKYGTISEWWFSAQYYYEIGQKIDLICGMTYNSSNITGAAYQSWMQDQTTNILKAVSGKNWNNDASHPAPTNGVKVLIGFPAYENGTFHTNVAENIQYAGLGTEAGLADLRARGDFSTNCFQGAAVYLHADGTGNDGFASYDKDWWWFGQYWLNTWESGNAVALVSPASRDFGTVAVGQTNSLPFAVVNTGDLSLTGTATVGGPFAVTAGGSYTVNPGQTQTVMVSFIPPSAGVFTDAVVFASSGGSSTNAVTGIGAVVPSAIFSGNPTNGTEPLLVTFSDTSTGTISNRLWNFGDNTTTNLTTNTVVHSYSAGTYDVTLVVTGPVGISTNTRLSYITVWTAYQAWQLQFFSCTNCPQAQPNADPLGKGMSNTNQFLAGLDPTNRASLFRIISAVQQSDGIKLTWTTAGGRSNAVQAAVDETGSYVTNFTDISVPIIVPGGGDTMTNYLDGGATNLPGRYYRIRLVP